MKVMGQERECRFQFKDRSGISWVRLGYTGWSRIIGFFCSRIIGFFRLFANNRVFCSRIIGFFVSTAVYRAVQPLQGSLLNCKLNLWSDLLQNPPSHCSLLENTPVYHSFLEHCRRAEMTLRNRLATTSSYNPSIKTDFYTNIRLCWRLIRRYRCKPVV